MEFIRQFQTFKKNRHMVATVVEDKITSTAQLRWQQVLADDDTPDGFLVEKTPS